MSNKDTFCQTFNKFGRVLDEKTEIRRCNNPSNMYYIITLLYMKSRSPTISTLRVFILKQIGSFVRNNILHAKYHLLFPKSYYKFLTRKGIKGVAHII